MPKKRHKMLIKVVSITLAIFFIVFITGSYRYYISVSEKPKKIEKDDKTDAFDDLQKFDSVSLDSVEPPRYGEPFCVLFTETQVLSADWGIATGEDNAYVSEKSAFPGFSSPMLIVVPDIALNKHEIVSITTQYGDYHYSVVGQRKAVLDDGKDNVCDSQDGSDIIDFYEKCEKLYVFSISQNICYLGKMTGGTIVVP